MLYCLNSCMMHNNLSFYEIVLTMQLVHLICRKGPVQPPTRKEGWDLFWRISDDNSINMNLKLPGSETPWQKKELQRAIDPPWRMKTTMGTRDNWRWRKECYDQRIIVDHGEWCIRYDFEKQRKVCSMLHMDLQEKVYKARFMICLRKNRIWHNILYWPHLL